MPSLSRRSAAAALAALPFCSLGRAQSATPLRATPRQTEGPFYPVSLPRDSDADLLRNGTLQYTLGEPAWVEGVVSDLQGRPLSGAQVEIWQCDQAGHYHHPGDRGAADQRFQGFGRVTVGSDGRYRFRTIKPAPYSGRTPHIHFKVRMDSRELLTTQLYVEGDPNNERDFLWRNLGEQRALVTVPFRRGGEGLQASFPIVVAA
jgi:protocatechuate 3,4-dioxygenase, beta subunit